MSAASASPWLRPFRRPWLWIGLWLVMIAAVVFASLTAASNLPPPAFDGIDKLEHFLGYFVLAAWAVNLFARRRPQALAGVALIALGVGLELAQAALTDSRQADSADALANALGVLAGLMLAATPLAQLLMRLDGGRRPPGK